VQRKQNQFQVGEVDGIVVIQVSVRIPALVFGLARHRAGNDGDVATGHFPVAAQVSARDAIGNWLQIGAGIGRSVSCLSLSRS
jgi:hypothetical protein